MTRPSTALLLQAAGIAPEESAAGILSVAEGLTLEQTGRFINHDGAELGW